MAEPAHLDAELTPEQVAQVLAVNDSFVLALLDAGELSHRMVNAQPLIAADSVMAFKAADDRRRRDAADELTQLSREWGLS